MMMHSTRIFKTPDELEKVWEEYKENLKVEAREWFKIQYVGKEGNRVTDAYKLPYSLDSFEVFCYKNHGHVEQYFKNKGGYYDDFVPLCTHIKKEIRANQITGGMLGVFNTSITQRLCNLSEKTEDVTPQEQRKLKITIKRDE